MSRTVRAAFNTLSEAEAAAARLRAEDANNKVDILQRGTNDMAADAGPDAGLNAATSLFGTASLGVGFPLITSSYNTSAPYAYVAPGDGVGSEAFLLEATVSDDAFDRAQAILGEMGGHL